MLKVTGNSIRLTRGDTMSLKIDLNTSTGDIYEPDLEDQLIFRMKKSGTAKDYLIEKEIPIETQILLLEEDDTKDLKFTSYVYEIELVTSAGYHYTVIENATFTIGTELENHG